MFSKYLILFILLQVLCNEFHKEGKLKQKQKYITFISASKTQGEEWVAYLEYL